MAGGFGSRLIPLTCDTPKPMLPIAGEPALHHIIRLLARCGVTEAAVTTMYLAEKTQSAGSEFEGVKLKYFREDTPLGTAGSVKQASQGFDEDFIVISGDCICDLDLTKAMAFHERKNADCTVVLARSSNPPEYGSVICGCDGKISRFIEKPAWCQVFSDCINTGIYIINPRVMQLVPQNTNYDFASDLFPRMLGGALYGCAVKGYWCDVGNLRDYYRCNFDAAQGKIGGIAKKPLICSSIIGDNCVIKSRVCDSILHNGVQVGTDSRADGCIICHDTLIGNSVTLGRGVVMGGGCVIGDNCVIADGVRIGSNIIIPKGSVVMQDMLHQNECAALFTDNGICGNLKGSLSPERCFALGAGCVIKEGDRVGVMSDYGTDAVGLLVKNCLINGISHGGGVPLDFGEGTRELSAYAALNYRQSVMLYVQTAGDSVCIHPLGSDSLSLKGETERNIKKSFENGTKCGTGTAKPITISGIRELYITNLVRGKSDMSGLVCGVSDTATGEILAQALEILGARVIKYKDSAPSDVPVSFDIQDRQLTLHIGKQFSADFEHIRAYLVHHKAPAYKNIAIPYTSPDILDDIAHRRGARVFRYLTTPTGEGDIAARSLAADHSQLIFRDMCFAALEICEILAEMTFDTGKLTAAFGVLPPFSQQTRDIDFENDLRADIMNRITRDPSPEKEGAQLIFRGGRALVIPKRTGGFRIIAEAVSTEAAREISFKTERKIYGEDEEE